MQRIETILRGVPWRRVPWRLYKMLLPAPLRRWIAKALSLRLPGLGGLGVGRLARLAIKDFFVDDMATYGAALAFHLLLALFPFVIFLVALLSFLHIPGFFDWLVSVARLALPVHTLGQVAQAVRQVRAQAQAHSGLLSVGIIAALWAASAGMRAVMNAVNVAYDVAESRPIWQRYTFSIAFTVGFTGLVIAATALMLLGPALIARLAAHVGLDRTAIVVWTWLRVPIVIVLLMLAVALIYYLAPNLNQPFRVLTPGAVLAVVVWLIASLIFSTYVGTVAHYSATYGSIAAIIVLLLYFYISALALLLGAEVNGIIYHHALQSHANARATAHSADAPQVGRKPVA